MQTKEKSRRKSKRRLAEVVNDGKITQFTHVVEISFLLVSGGGDMLIAVCILRGSLLKHFGQSLLQLCILILQLLSIRQCLLHAHTHNNSRNKLHTHDNNDNNNHNNNNNNLLQ